MATSSSSRTRSAAPRPAPSANTSNRWVAGSTVAALGVTAAIVGVSLEARDTPQESVDKFIGDMDDVSTADPNLVVGIRTINGSDESYKGRYQGRVVFTSADKPTNLSVTIDTDRSGVVTSGAVPSMESHERPDGSYITTVRTDVFDGAIGDPVDIKITGSGLDLQTSAILQPEGRDVGKTVTGPSFDR